jgi:hypothetical protein
MKSMTKILLNKILSKTNQQVTFFIHIIEQEEHEQQCISKDCIIF